MDIGQVGQGTGRWSGNDAQLASLKNGTEPPFRDTVTLIPDSTSIYNTKADCGWVAIRFVADNPGAWGFHCHIVWHQLMGMQAVVIYPPEEMPAPPPDYPLCGISDADRLAHRALESFGLVCEDSEESGAAGAFDASRHVGIAALVALAATSSLWYW
eukprot:1179183-Prorocentrum_minimum.AAC.1